MPNGQAQIVISASPVADDKRHTYFLFEASDGSRTVVRGGPDGRGEGSDLGNFIDNILTGSKDFGDISVVSAPYASPYTVGYKVLAGNEYQEIPVN